MQLWSEVREKQSKTFALRASLRRERRQQSQGLFREPCRCHENVFVYQDATRWTPAVWRRTWQE